MEVRGHLLRHFSSVPGGMDGTATELLVIPATRYRRVLDDRVFC